MDLEVIVEDSVLVEKDERLQVVVGVPATVVKINPGLGLTQVSLSDAWQVVPYAKRITMDFDLPESITQGLFVDIVALNEAILAEVGAREIAIIGVTEYNKDYTDGVIEQVYTTIDAEYIATVTDDSYVLKTEMTRLALDYDTATGTTTATLQDIYSGTVDIGNAQASLNENITALAENDAALVTRTTDLEASIDGVDGLAVRLTEIEGVAAGLNHIWFGDPEDILLIGYVKFENAIGTLRTSEESILPDDIQYKWMGGILGWVATDAASYGIATQAYDWAGGASSFVTGPNDEITGWSFADGSNVQSTFAIAADSFYIENSSVPGYKPFTIDGTDVQFDGIVDFTSTNVKNGFPGTTTINGGLIETNTLNANRINANTIWVDGRIESSNFSAFTSGFRLKSNAASTYSDPDIYGAYIRGGSIYGTHIMAVTIDTVTLNAAVINTGILNAAILNTPSINGMKFKMGSFLTEHDNNYDININTDEGRLYTTTPGVYSQVGSTSGGFSGLMSVLISCVGPNLIPTTSPAPAILNAWSFRWDRDDVYDGNQVFSYVAWGY